MDVSIVIVASPTAQMDPIAELYAEYKRQIEKTGLSYEFVFVLEGDQPETIRTLESVRDHHEPIEIVNLLQSYGDASVLSVGFRVSKAPIIMTLPAYHQVDPNEIPALVAAIDGADMVVVRRWPRHDGIINRIQTRAFYRLLRSSVGSDFHDLGCAVRVMRKRVTESVHIYGHKHWFLPVLASKQGFKIKEVNAAQSKRDSSRKNFRVDVYVRRLLDLLSIFFLVKFTKKPLRFFGLTGLIVFLLGGTFTAYLTFQRFFMGIPLADRPALLLGVLMIVLGIQLLAIGLIGELIIFTHARDLQEYTVENTVN